MTRIKNILLSMTLVVILLLGNFSPFALDIGIGIRYSNAEIQEASWTQILQSPFPGAKRSAAWAYDNIHNVIVLFGGVPGTSETWVYDLTTETWEQKFPSVSPPGRSVHTMTFDSKAGVVVLFGGYRLSHTTHLSDTWIYDVGTNTWDELNTTVSPPARHWPGLVYDKDDEVVVLFGGHDPSSSTDEIKNDTWILDVGAQTWTEVFPGESPSPRQTSLIYNEGDGLVYLFGGTFHVTTNNTNKRFNDIWSYDVSTNSWTKLPEPPILPTPRRSKWVYDPINDIAVMFGGKGPFDGGASTFRYYDDTWVYDFQTNTWTEIVTTTHPVARHMNMIIYDPINRLTLQ